MQKGRGEEIWKVFASTSNETKHKIPTMIGWSAPFQYLAYHRNHRHYITMAVVCANYNYRDICAINFMAVLGMNLEYIRIHAE